MYGWDLTPINLFFSCLGLSLKPGCYPKFLMKANSPGVEGRSSPCPITLGILLCPETREPKGFAGRGRNISQLTDFPESALWLARMDAQMPRLLNK